jgi:Arc/MetJ-type ribon-helix-helix transcriptional regulator
MKVKASFTISDKTLKAIDRLVGRRGNRSAFVEQALQAAIKQRDREVRDARDVALYAKYAAEIHREQAELDEILAAFQTSDDDT